jgi:hypothetical protein
MMFIVFFLPKKVRIFDNFSRIGIFWNLFVVVVVKKLKLVKVRLSLSDEPVQERGVGEETVLILGVGHLSKQSLGVLLGDGVACSLNVRLGLSGVYTGVKTINSCRWQLRFEIDFSILKLHRSAKSPTPHCLCI